MSSHDFSRASVAVIKIGGSIFTDAHSYHRAASFVLRRLAKYPSERAVIVVSAQNGLTDSLLAEARAIVSEPNRAALDLLWSTGELRSVALLALHLQALGISAAALSVHETGLYLAGSGFSASDATINPSRIRAALAFLSVAVVPGFFAVKSSGPIASLGRGGSDLTAVLLAAGLGASRCELIKDVPGYFSEDPHRSTQASHLSRLSFQRAIAMANEGCDLVQLKALETAERCDLPLVVRGLDEDAPETWVVSESSSPQMRIAQAPA